MSKLFGGGGGGEPEYQPREVQDDEKKFRKLRTALFKTAGGAMGEEIEEGGVAKDTFFGN